MVITIQNSGNCKVRLLWVKNCFAADIHHKLCALYGKNIVNDSTVRKWCHLFWNGRTNVHDEKISGWPPLVMDELVTKSEWENLRKPMFQNCVSFPSCITNSFVRCCNWQPSYMVLKIFTDDHKTKRMGAALTVFLHYGRERDEFLNHIVTGNETWV